MKFRAEMEIEVADHDADVMRQFPDHILNRFAGTAVNVTRILVTREERNPDSDNPVFLIPDPDNPEKMIRVEFTSRQKAKGRGRTKKS